MEKSVRRSGTGGRRRTWHVLQRAALGYVVPVHEPGTRVNASWLGSCFPHKESYPGQEPRSRNEEVSGDDQGICGRNLGHDLAPGPDGAQCDADRRGRLRVSRRILRGVRIGHWRWHHDIRPHFLDDELQTGRCSGC